ncbi:12080_t:CDS:2 [Ambispora gerdemannii]|uniref:12080_t:CDS:1 n=1 Tax=Ambispora gerdemannii TaxID=144530 RepID=A0A9N8YZF9_9GLOM|nr:12080_t:CDS:2 [Ambispora gerdemannii]
MESNFCERCNNNSYNPHIKFCAKCDGALWTSDIPLALYKLLLQEQLSVEKPIDLTLWTPYKNFDSIEYMKSGRFADVFKAEWKEGPIRNWDPTNRHFERCPNHIIKAHLQCKRNDSMVSLLYAVSQKPQSNEIVLVMRYAELGDLKTFLKLSEKDPKHLSHEERIMRLGDAASALSDIHEIGLIHGNIHSGNILFTKNNAHICDFGRKSFNDSRSIRDILPYIAPEVLQHKPYSKKADIYGFGMIMWEMFTCEMPFKGVPHELIWRCWDPDPDNRPNSSEIVEILYESAGCFIDEDEEEAQNWFQLFDSVSEIQQSSYGISDIEKDDAIDIY